MLTANSFKTQMKWISQQAVLDIPAARKGLEKKDQESRQTQFREILKDVADIMVEDFRKENISTYRSLTIINYIIISLGIALIITAVVQGALVGTDALTAIAAGVGVADFVAIFLVNPQSRITGLLKDFSQYEIIFFTWSSHVKVAYDALITSDFSDAQIEKFQTSLAKYSDDAIKAIETNIGKD